MILPVNIIFNDLKIMNKVFCNKCKHKEFGIMNYYCKAGKIHNKPIHHKDTFLMEAYDERLVFDEEEMKELNKDNNCPYYEKNI